MGNMHEFPACIDAGGLLPRAPSKTGFTPPQRFVLIEQFKGIMLEALAHNASDVYIQPGLPICARINGDLMALTPSTLDESEVKYMIKWTSGRDTAETDILSGVPVNARYELFSPNKLDARGAKVRHGYRVNISSILYFAFLSFFHSELGLFHRNNSLSSLIPLLRVVIKMLTGIIHPA